MGHSAAEAARRQVCPDCRSTKITVTLLTSRGAYCRCRVCGRVWHQEAAHYGTLRLPPQVRRVLY